MRVREKNIAIVDYISYINRFGEPVGHPLKVMREYAKWLDGDYEITYAAHPAYLSEIGPVQNRRDKYVKELSGCIREQEDYTTISGKLRQLSISWNNIREVWNTGMYDYIWFFNIDIFLFFFLLFHKKKRERVIITTYLSEFPIRYQNRIFMKILPDLKLIISSNPCFEYKRKNYLYIPDYLYDGTIYERYRNLSKEDKAVCVGAMVREKDLDGLICAFNRNGVKLIIAGYFKDPGYYEELLGKAGNNIEIRNEYIQYEEYLELLGSAKFSILPYDENVYGTKTSGVLLESIFVDTIPVCKAELLEQWKIAGRGYGCLDELQKKDWFYEDNESILIRNRELIETEYNKKLYIDRLKERLR